MSGERLSGLCVMSVHHEKISKDKQGFIVKEIDRFGRDLRHLQILFLNDVYMCC